MRDAVRTQRGDKRPTIRDVALASGVSRQTVSNVLNAPERVTPSTKERVLAAVELLRYAPNEAARSLTSKLTRTVAISIGRTEHNPSAIEDPFFHALIREAAQRDHRILALDRGSDDDMEIAAYAQVWNRRVADAFILTDTRLDDPRPARLAEMGVPFVAFGSPWGQSVSQHDWVDVDGAHGMRLAVEHVIERGHRRLGFIGWQPDGVGGDVRADGWAAAVQSAGLEPSMRAHATADSIDSGRVAASELIRRKNPPTAFICASDILALGTMLALEDAGLTPGVDAAVVGYDDSIVATIARPTMSSIRQPLETVAQFLLESVDRLVHGRRGLEPRTCMVAPQLVVRASSAAQRSVWSQ